MPSSIPRMDGKKRCKVCLQNLQKTFWMENLGDKIKCPNCGREVAIGGRRSPHRGVLRSADPVRFRTGRSRQSGERKNDASDFKPTFFKTANSKLRGTSKVSVGKLPQDPNMEIFEEKDCVTVISAMPGVKKRDIQCQLEGNVLKIHTTGNREYKGEIEIPVSVAQEFDLKYNNGVVEILFKKE